MFGRAQQEVLKQQQEIEANPDTPVAFQLSEGMVDDDNILL